MADDGEAGAEPGCKHYSRNVELKAVCCQRFVPCRLCHDEAGHEDLKACQETMDRHAVTTVRCTACSHEQKVQQNCEKCGVEFGKYFCGLCRLYDNKDKGQFHCEGCGICRVGGRETFRHCDRCHACYDKDFFEKHKCTEKALQSNCPVCLEFLATTVKPLHVPDCGHILHRECFQELVKSSYTCPTCSKSFFDMSAHFQRLDEEIAATPMPTEYRNKRILVLCNDCHETTTTRFHIISLKCQNCGSHNTSQASGLFDAPEGEESEDDGEDAEGGIGAGLRDAIGRAIAGALALAGGRGDGDEDDEGDSDDDDMPGFDLEEIDGDDDDDDDDDDEWEDVQDGDGETNADQE